MEFSCDDFDSCEAAIVRWIESEGGKFVPPAKKRRNRGLNCVDGVEIPKIDCWSSSWGLLLNHPNTANCDTREGKKFRRRFRIPFPLFRDVLVPLAKERNLFKTKRKSHIPIEFKILLSLRILGRGVCADDINELVSTIVTILYLSFRESIHNVRLSGVT
jgi:hypothetical protein